MNHDCFACRSLKFKYIKQNNHTVRVCEYCGLGETLGFKTPDYSVYHRDNCYEKESELVNNYAEKFFQLANFPTIKKTVLEVGCSTGLLLKQFSQNGWVTSGIEPSKSAANYASGLGLNVSNTDLEHFDTKDKFTLVVMIHVLEHVDDPRQTIKRLSKLIRPKGRLFLSVPNFGGLTPTLLGSCWPYLLPNEHRWHFTLKSLSLLLGDCGFTIIKSETNAGIFGLAHPGRQLLWSLTHLKKIFFRLLLFLPYDLVSTKLNTASNLVITSQRASAA